MEEFSLANLQSLTFAQSQEYVAKYFVPLATGNIAVYINKTFKIMETSVVKSTYFKRMSKDINTWFFEKYTDLRHLEYKLNKPRLYDNKLNLCPPLLHTYQPYDTFDEAARKGVDIMLNYVFEVLANKNKEYYDYLLKWIANMMKGNKNDSALYFKGVQGLGKSTLFVFIRDFVIGRPLVCENGSEPIKSRFNEILGGKLLVCFEELETFSTNEWIAVSSRLKRYITSNSITLEGKGTNSYETENINNYVILSNNDAIKDDDGRRYFTSDISTKRKGDKAFWENIRNSCFNEVVGKAFYCYFCEIDTTGFYAQNYPITNSKKDALAMRLPQEQKFIKDYYIRNNRGIHGSVDEVYKSYKDYCSLTNFTKILGKINFCKKLREINIEFYKSDDTNKYNVSYKFLANIANENNWIHELDDIIVDGNLDKNATIPNELEIAQEALAEKSNQVLALIAENAALKAEMIELKNQHAIQHCIKEIIKQPSVKVEDKQNFKKLTSFK